MFEKKNTIYKKTLKIKNATETSVRQSKICIRNYFSRQTALEMEN